MCYTGKCPNEGHMGDCTTQGKGCIPDGDEEATVVDENELNEAEDRIIALTAANAELTREADGLAESLAKVMRISQSQIDALPARLQSSYRQAIDDAARVVSAVLAEPHGYGLTRELMKVRDTIRALSPKGDTCEWSRPRGWEGMYDTACGHLHDYEDGYTACPYCGLPITVAAGEGGKG